MKKLLSLAISFVLVLSCFTISIVSAEDYTSKLSDELKTKISTLTDDDIVSVYLWLEKPDFSGADEEIAELTEELEKDIIAEQYCDYKKISLEDYNNGLYGVSPEEFEEEIESLRHMRGTQTTAYIRAKRIVSAERYSANNKAILDLLEIPQEDRIFESRYSSMCTVNLTVAKLYEVIESDKVESVKPHTNVAMDIGGTDDNSYYSNKMSAALNEKLAESEDDEVFNVVLQFSGSADLSTVEDEIKEKLGFNYSDWDALSDSIYQAYCDYKGWTLDYYKSGAHPDVDIYEWAEVTADVRKEVSDKVDAYRETEKQITDDKIMDYYYECLDKLNISAEEIDNIKYYHLWVHMSLNLTKAKLKEVVESEIVSYVYWNDEPQDNSELWGEPTGAMGGLDVDDNDSNQPNENNPDVSNETPVSNKEDIVNYKDTKTTGTVTKTDTKAEVKNIEKVAEKTDAKTTGTEANVKKADVATKISANPDTKTTGAVAKTSATKATKTATKQKTLVSDKTSNPSTGVETTTVAIAIASLALGGLLLTSKKRK